MMPTLRDQMADVSPEALEAMMATPPPVVAWPTMPTQEGLHVRHWVKRASREACSDRVTVVWHRARQWTAHKWCWLADNGAALACEGWDYGWEKINENGPRLEEETDRLACDAILPRSFDDTRERGEYYNYFCDRPAVVRAAMALQNIDLDDGAYPAYLRQLLKAMRG